MRIEWDKNGERRFETGSDHGVLYVLKNGRYTKGVPWNGLTAVNENPTGAEPSPIYADNIKYVNIMSAEEYAATIEAFTYPDEFKDCVGEVNIANGVFIGQQKRRHFGFCYRTKLGNDEEETDFGYKIHIVFNAIAKPPDKQYGTVNDNPDAVTFSWEISTEPIPIDDHKPSSVLELESNKFKIAGLFNVLKAIEDMLYGTESTDPKFPKVSEILDIYSLQMYIRDSSNELLTDSSGNRIQSRVFD